MVEGKNIILFVRLPHNSPYKAKVKSSNSAYIF